MTEKLYYEDIYCEDFEARVLEVVEDKKGFRVTLDRTCFFPEGGGQPPDKGWLAGFPVFDVRKEGEVVYHYLAQEPGHERVQGKIDMGWRRDFMQQHTGQHIISAALWRVGTYKTLSVHMGTDITTIEIDALDIPEENVSLVEDIANRAVLEDLPIEAVYTREDELHKFPLRKPVGHKGTIRLVCIGDFDCVGCGGLHFDRTREVGLIKAVGVEKIRGHARLSWKIGKRATIDYREKDRIISDLRPLLDTGEDRFLEKISALQKASIFYKRRNSLLENRLAEIMARELYEGRKALPGAPAPVVLHSWQGEEEVLVKKILKSLLDRPGLLVCLANILPGKVQWSIGCPGEFEFPFDQYKTALLEPIAGKGGGRHPLWQGTGGNIKGVKEFFSLFERAVQGRF